MRAILGLLDVEIRIFERKRKDVRSRKILRIERFYSKEYLEDQLELTKEKLGQQVKKKLVVKLLFSEK